MKAEQFINDYTKSCSNELSISLLNDGKLVKCYHEWVTPEVARGAVKIAREETINKACEWLDKHSWDYIRGDMLADKHMIKDFRKAMEE